MADEETVRVLRPDGRYSRIPVKALAQAITAGYSVVGQAPGPPTPPRELSEAPSASERAMGFYRRALDRVSENMEALGNAPERTAKRSRELFQEPRKKGDITGMGVSIPRAELEQLRDLLSGIYGVSTPGLIQRIGRKEDPAKIAGDMGMFFLPGMEEGRTAEAGLAENAARNLERPSQMRSAESAVEMERRRGPGNEPLISPEQQAAIVQNLRAAYERQKAAGD